MLSIIFAVVGALLTFYGAFSIHRSNKKMKQVKDRQKEITAPQKPEPAKDWVKIGKMDASFNKELHKCKKPSTGPWQDETKGWDIGTVIACNVRECGQEWVLGYYEETARERQSRIDKTNAAYERSGRGLSYSVKMDNRVTRTEAYMPPVVPQEIKKQWYTMEQYQKDPDKYVYFT